MEGDIQICGLSNRYNEDVLFERGTFIRDSAAERFCFSVCVTFPTSSAVRKHRLRLKASGNFFFLLELCGFKYLKKKRSQCMIIKILSKVYFNRALFINRVGFIPMLYTLVFIPVFCAALRAPIKYAPCLQRQMLDFVKLSTRLHLSCTVINTCCSFIDNAETAVGSLLRNNAPFELILKLFYICKPSRRKKILPSWMAAERVKR